MVAMAVGWLCFVSPKAPAAIGGDRMCPKNMIVDRSGQYDWTSSIAMDKARLALGWASVEVPRECADKGSNAR